MLQLIIFNFWCRGEALGVHLLGEAIPLEAIDIQLSSDIGAEVHIDPWDTILN